MRSLLFLLDQIFLIHKLMLEAIRSVCLLTLFKCSSVIQWHLLFLDLLSICSYRKWASAVCTFSYYHLDHVMLLSCFHASLMFYFFWEVTTVASLTSETFDALQQATGMENSQWNNWAIGFLPLIHFCWHTKPSFEFSWKMWQDREHDEGIIGPFNIGVVV